MKWFKRLFGMKQESQTTRPEETPASVAEKGAEPPTPAAGEPVDTSANDTSDEATSESPVTSESSEEPQVAPTKESSSDPALSRLDGEHTAAQLPEPQEQPPEAEDADEDTEPPVATSVAEQPASAGTDESAVEKATEVAQETSPVESSRVDESPVEPSVAEQAEEKAAEQSDQAAPVTPATTAEEVAEHDETGPFGPGSAKPLADGAAPGDEYTVKAKRSSKLFHTAESPYFGRTKADVWFKTPADAESAGFSAWNHKKKAATAK